MSGVCDGPSFRCPTFGTKDQLTHSETSLDLTHNENRVFALSIGNKTVPINKRTRSYRYRSDETTRVTNGKVIIDANQAYVDCGTQTDTEGATISEHYETVDCALLYADLRYDTLIYEEKTAVMDFSQASPSRSVALQVSFGDAHVYPFIKEEVPIIRTTKIISTDFSAPLHIEVINAGYWDGIRILMPDWHGGNPRHSIFTIEGIQYDAANVDWYDAFLNWQTDGDRVFWWPSWLRAVPVNTELDEYEATKIYDTYHGLVTPNTTQALSAVSTKDFTGSSAHSRKSEIFLSAKFDTINGQVVLVNKLVVNGEVAEIPTEKIYVKQPDDTYIKQDSEHTCYYPIAPL